MQEPREKIDISKLKRTSPPPVEPKKEDIPPPVSSPAGKALDLGYNPTRDKEREVTVVDRYQVRLLPLIDVTNTGLQYVLEIAYYRQDADVYEELYGRVMPVPPNLMEEYIHRMVQWNKSRDGAAFNKLNELIQIEMETKAMDDEGGLRGIGKWDAEE